MSNRIDLSVIDWHYINLAHRKDRLAKLLPQLSRHGITAARFEAQTQQDFTGSTRDSAAMLARTGHAAGAVGCYQSHMTLWEQAIAKGTKILGVIEDDAIICDDFQQRLQYIAQNFDREWDILFLSAVYHCNPSGWHTKPLGRDFELTDLKYIHRVYGSFGTQCYLVNGERLPKLRKLMADNIYRAYAVDHCLLQLQPSLQCFSFTPGCVFQSDGASDVGTGWSQFSNFYRICGRHVFAAKLSDFDYDNYNWAEGRI